MLIPQGLPFSDAQVNPVTNTEKFDAGFYDKIQQLQLDLPAVSGASGDSDEQYYSVVLVTDDKEDLVNDLADEYQARNIFNPEYLDNVVTADVPINLITILSTNYNVIKIGDGELEIKSIGTFNPNNSTHTSIKQAKAFHGLASDVSQTGEGIVVGVVDRFFTTPHVDLPSSKIIQKKQCSNFSCSLTLDLSSDPHFNSVSSIIAGTGSSNSDMKGFAYDSSIIFTGVINEKARIKALNYLVGQNVDLIAIVAGRNVSCTSDYPMIAIVVDNVVSNGVTVVVGVANQGKGNNLSNQILDSSCSYNSIPVANIDKNGIIADSSSRGGFGVQIKPDISALGTNIAGATTGSNYDAVSGTSFSTPIVAGVTALLLDKDSTLMPSEIRNALLLGAEFGYDGTATSKLYEDQNVNLYNYFNSYGFGKLNVGNSLSLINDNQFPNIISDGIRAISNTHQYRIHADSGDDVKVLVNWLLETTTRDPINPELFGNTPVESFTNFQLEVKQPDGIKIISDSSEQTREFVFFTAEETGFYEIKLSVDDRLLISSRDGSARSGSQYTIGSSHPLDKYPFDSSLIPIVNPGNCQVGEICDIGGTPEVNSPPVISVTPRTINANSGDTITLVATVFDANDDDTAVSWEVGREDIDIDLTISSDGNTASFVVPHSNTVSSAFFLIRAIATDQYQATSNTVSSLVIATISNPVTPPTTPTPDPVIPTGSAIFSDDFENGISKWETTGTWRADSFDEGRIPPGHSSSNNVAEADGCSSCTLTQAYAINLQNYNNEYLQFYRYVDTSLDAGEYLQVQVYNVNEWVTLDSWDAATSTTAGLDDDVWHLETYDLSEYTDVLNFKIRFVAQASSGGEDVGIDDVQILATQNNQGGGGGDRTPPVISNVPDDILLSSTGDSAAATFDIPTVNEGTISCNYSSGDLFPIGTTTVICTATDSFGNTSSISFDVIVTFTDVTDPVLTVPGDKTFEATDIDTFLTLAQIGTATATDNSGSAIVTSNVTDSYPLGDTIVVYTATDVAGNSSTDTQIITVQDTTPPVISNVPADFTSDSSTVSYDLPTVTDIFPVTISCNPAPGSEFIAGDNLVTCTAIDDNANSAIATFNVNVDTPIKSASITSVNTGSSYIPFIDGMTISDNIPKFRGTSENLDEVQLLIGDEQVGVTTNVLYDGRWTKHWTSVPLDDGAHIITVREHGVDIASFSIIIDAVHYPKPTSFVPINDIFDSLDSWSFTRTLFQPIESYKPFNLYFFTLYDFGNPGTAGLISGDGFSAQAEISQSIGIPSNVTSLFVGIDYRVVSDSVNPDTTNTRFKILDINGRPLFSEQLVPGGTTDSGWKSFVINATEFIEDNDSLVIELSHYDIWTDNIHQYVIFDNFFARANP